MADIRKEQEREELHKAIWSIADDLRGSVDGWDFKQYVLGMMFYRYISPTRTPSSALSTGTTSRSRSSQAILRYH